MVDGKECSYPDGESLTVLELDRRYSIDSIGAGDDPVVVMLKINDRADEITWIGEEAVSFF